MRKSERPNSSGSPSPRETRAKIATAKESSERHDSSPQDVNTAQSPSTRTAVSEPRAIQIVVNSVMQGVKQATVFVPVTCIVRELKFAIEQATEVSIDRQLLLFKNNELKEDSTKITDYGITRDCNITMNVKMSTGIATKPTPNFIFFVPVALPENTETLRKTIKNMNSVRRPKKAPTVEKNSNIWTPEKHLEAELTRNRIKTLLRRKKTHTLTETPIDSGQSSVQTYSPVATPPEWNHPENAVGSPATSPVVAAGASDEPPVTEKELKLFFDPPETMEELNRARRELFLPPQNEAELQGIREKLEAEKKTRCSYCGKKLPLLQQTMRCKCERLFCDRHRQPEVHMCRIDYKQEGRRKLKKDNTKVGDGGERKAQFGQKN